MPQEGGGPTSDGTGADLPVRVLVVSTDEVWAEVLAARLRALRLEVDRARAIATVAPEALAGIDVVLLETQGGGEDDRSVFERLREQSPLTEVVAICPPPRVGAAVEALRAGVFAILTHTVGDRQLLDSLRAAGARKRRGQRRLLQLNHDRVTRRAGERLG